jgi:hypothetical protein
MKRFIIGTFYSNLKSAKLKVKSENKVAGRNKFVIAEFSKNQYMVITRKQVEHIIGEEKTDGTYVEMIPEQLKLI